MLGIIHYITNGTDGVSLEIQKRTRVFKELGLKYRLIDKNIFSFLDLSQNKTLNFLYINITKFLCNNLRLKKDVTLFHKQFVKFFSQFNINQLYVHNLLSLPIKPAVSLGLLYAIKKLNIKTISINHDFWQTRNYFLKVCKKFLDDFPPNLINIKHQVINSLDIKFLQKQGINNYKVIHDYWDSSIINYYKGSIALANLNPKKQLILLNASRIIRRKAIENSVYFVFWLKKIATPNMLKNKEPILLLSNIKDVDKKYLQELKNLAKKLNVKIIISANQEYFWNLYKMADVILYTTIQEGFGNQFLEAIYYKKPLVLFEYPVFLSDIKNKGFSYISLGHVTFKYKNFHFVPDVTIKKAVNKLLFYLTNGRNLWDKLSSKNFKLLHKYFGKYKLLKDIKEDLLFLYNDNILKSNT